MRKLSRFYNPCLPYFCSHFQGQLLLLSVVGDKRVSLGKRGLPLATVAEHVSAQIWTRKDFLKKTSRQISTLKVGEAIALQFDRMSLETLINCVQETKEHSMNLDLSLSPQVLPPLLFQGPCLEGWPVVAGNDEAFLKRPRTDAHRIF